MSLCLLFCTIRNVCRSLATILSIVRRLIFKLAYGPGGPGWTRYDIGWNVRHLIGAWPYAAYSLYDEKGGYDKEMLCIPPSMCGPMLKETIYDPEDEERKEAMEAEMKEEVPVSEELLEQARSAAPALLAKYGDRFMWTVRSDKNALRYCSTSLDYSIPRTVLTFVGRNEVPPEKLDLSGIRFDNWDEYKQPELGWWVFRGNENQIDAPNGHLRDGINAWPLKVYTHYNTRGESLRGTLCIPANKLGPLKRWEWER